MAIQGSIPITTLERAVSTDVVAAQDLINRSLAEFVKCFARTSEAGGNAWVRDHMTSGLRMTQSGGVLQLQPGVLAQDVASNPPDVPAAGTFDSSYRFGLQLAQAALSDPWDASDKYWLLQARVVRETTLSEKRDIYNPTLDTFALSGTDLDKRYESQVETAWKTGTSTTIPSADTGYAAIAAVWRPSGGGTITDADIIQLAIQFDDLTSVYTDNELSKRTSRKLRCGDGIGVPSSDCFFSFSGEIQGKKLFAKANTAVSLRHATFIDPGDIGLIGSSGVWWYVYLADTGDVIPSNMYTDIDHRGAIVVSRTPPTDYGTNSSTITIPDPINVAVAANSAMFVGCFRSDGAANDIEYINIASNGEGVIEREASSFLMPSMNSSNNFGETGTPDWTTSYSGREVVPYGCHLKFELRTIALDVASTALAIGLRFAFSSDSLGLQDESYCSCRSPFVNHIELSPRDRDITVTVDARTLDANMSATGSFPSDGGTNSIDMVLTGIRLI